MPSEMSVGPDAIRSCNGCKQIKPLVAFATFRSRKGELRRRGICKECREKQCSQDQEVMRAYRRKYNRRTKSARQVKQNACRANAKRFVDEYKSKPCADCKRKLPTVAMDLDHVRGAKHKSVSLMVSAGYKIDLIKEEVAKCDIVCACCHRIRTAKRGENLGGSAIKLGRRPTNYKKSKQRVHVNSKRIMFKGEVRSIAEWARELGLNQKVIRYRLSVGYTPEEAFVSSSYTTKSSPTYEPAVGEKVRHAKLKEADVLEILRRLELGETQTALAIEFDVSQTAISMIVRGKNWSYPTKKGEPK